MRRSAKSLFKRAKLWAIDGLLARGHRFRYPEELIIESTNICSLACTCCPNGCDGADLRPRGRMTRQTFDRVLANIDIPVKRCYLHMCGEPMLCPDLPYYVQRLNDRGITAIVFSNGYRVDLQLLRQTLACKKLKMAFSADLLSADHYQGIRHPATYSAMRQSLRDIDDVFAQCNRYYGLNVIVDASAIADLPEVCAGLFDTYSRLNTISLSSQWPWPKLSQSGDLPGHLTDQRRLCPQVKTSMPILWNGDVAFCASDYCGDTIVGSVLERTYSSVFNSAGARRFRRAFYMGREASLPMCAQCVYPRYNAMSMMLYRQKFMRMDPAARRQALRPIADYYDI